MNVSDIEYDVFLEWVALHEAEFAELADLIRQYPDEPVLNLLKEIFELTPELTPGEYDVGF